LKSQIQEEVQDPAVLLNLNEIDEPLQKAVDMVFHNQTNALKETAFSLAKK